MHSLWGIIGGYQKEFHLTHEGVLWGEPWINLQMKVIDSIRRIKKPVRELETAEELAEFIKTGR